jgi:hypothetical protein
MATYLLLEHDRGAPAPVNDVPMEHASSAASTSSPRRTRPANTRWMRARSAPSSSCRIGS